MKKTYISPSAFVVELTHTHNILTGSGSISTTSATFYDDDATGAAMVKESSNSSVWDNEW